MTEPPFWHMVTSTEVSAAIGQALNEDVGSIGGADDWHDDVKLYERYQVNTGTGFYHKRIPSEEARPRLLHIKAKGFSPDYFEQSGIFVSRKFREVAQLSDSEVQYLDVICDPCTPEAKAQDYKMLWVLGREDVLDMEKSVIHPPDAPWNLQWRIANPQKFVYRKDARTTSRIFHDKNSWFVYVTNELAQKLLDAGIDVAFIDESTLIDGVQRPKTRRVD